MSEILQFDFKRNAQKLDCNALADALEAQGKFEEAKRFRDMAQREPEIEARTMADRKTHLDKLIHEDNQKAEEARANIPQLPHDPRFDAKELGTHTIEAIKNMLQPANQNKPPSAPNAPKGPTPSGGK